MKKIVALALLVCLLLIGCGGATANINETFAICDGETLKLAGTSMSLVFESRGRAYYDTGHSEAAFVDVHNGSDVYPLNFEIGGGDVVERTYVEYEGYTFELDDMFADSPANRGEGADCLTMIVKQ